MFHRVFIFEVTKSHKGLCGFCRILFSLQGFLEATKGFFRGLTGVYGAFFLYSEILKVSLIKGSSQGLLQRAF